MYMSSKYTRLKELLSSLLSTQCGCSFKETAQLDLSSIIVIATSPIVKADQCKYPPVNGEVWGKLMAPQVVQPLRVKVKSE